MTLNEFLKGIADAIREKKGTTELINPQSFATEIKSIESGGGSITNGVEWLEVDSNNQLIKAKVYGDIVPYKGFSSQDRLVSLELSDDITKLCDYACNGCKKLTIIKMSKNITYIGKYSLGNTAINSIEFPKGVTTIESGVFAGCGSLVITKIPDWITMIGSYGFQMCTSLKSLELPNGIYVSNSSFVNCTGLTTVTFYGETDGRTNIYMDAFKGCTNLTTINVPWAEGEVADAPWGATNATINYNYVGEQEEPEQPEDLNNVANLYSDTLVEVSDYMFEKNEVLQTVDLPNATTIGDFAFSKCTNLATLNLPNVTRIETYAFNNCSNLSTINIPKVTSIGEGAFQHNANLSTVTLLNNINIGTNAFYNSGVEKVDIHGTVTFGSSVFNYDAKLKSLILRSETIVPLSSANVLNYTPIGNKQDGYVYVPRSLLSDDDSTKDYRMATNWVSVASQFRALEDYTVDGTIMGELDPTKI